MQEAWLLLLDVLNTLNHSKLAKFAEQIHVEVQKDPLDTEMGPDEPYLKWHYEANRIVRIIKDIYFEPLKPNVKDSVERLLEIIRRSETYITSRGVFGYLPCREEDVHRRIEGILKCFFPDVETRPPLPGGPIKSFEADSGIKSLGVLIDYKFLEAEAEGKVAVEQVLADIGGYQSVDYTCFVFVFYETMRTFREDEWKRQLANSKPRSRVEAIVLKGTPPSAEDRDFSENSTRKKLAKASAARGGKAVGRRSQRMPR